MHFAVEVLYFYACWGGQIVNMGIRFLCLQVRLGKNGVEEVLGLGPLSDYEKEGLEKLKPELQSSIEKGIKFANQ
jgi:malate/lactate dehydrogenase